MNRASSGLHELTGPLATLSQEANLRGIEQIGTGEWVTLYLYEPTTAGGRCYFCALIPKRSTGASMATDSWDLMIGDGLPGFSQSYASGRKTTRYHRFGSAPIEPLIFRRAFHDLRPGQFDLLEEFRHFHNLYHDRANDRYIHIDDNGTEEVVVEVSPNRVRAKLRRTLQFLAAKQMALAVFFDHRASTLGIVDDAKSLLPDRSADRDDLRYAFHVGEVMGNTFSRLLGKKLIAPPPLKESGVWPYDRERKQEFAEFIIDTDEKRRSVMHTCDKSTLANYFGANSDSPHYLTPVWFTRDVLRKYYDHPEKYTVEDGYLRCGSLWGLQIDNDHPQHVMVYLGDLGRLAYEEQLYWKGFNVTPVSDCTSDTNFKRSFLAQFADATSPDFVFKRKLVAHQEGWEQRYGWQLFRQLHDADAHVIKQLRIPLSNSMGELEHQALLLAKILVDALDDTRLAHEIGGAKPDERSISKLERFFELRGYPHRVRDIDFLRLLQGLRSTAAAHLKGIQFQKLSEKLQLKDKEASLVFRELLVRANEMLTDIDAYFLKP